jgi:disulfide bond formation protein DsbB
MLEIMLQVNWWVATGTLLLEIALLGKLFSLIVVSLPENFLGKSFRTNLKELIFGTKQKIFHRYGLDVLSEKFLIFFIFLFSLAASIMTQVYSEIFLQEPCSLCWFQRVFMYGVVVLSGIGLFKNSSKNQSTNILVFSIFGALFSLYQHVMQILALYGTKLPCPATSVDCSKMIVFEYGHITFPWMAFVLFAFFIVIILLQRKLSDTL